MSDLNETSSKQTGWTDHQVELLIGNLLRIGVGIAALVVILGGIPYLIANGTLTPQYHTFVSPPPKLSTVSGILAGALHLDSRAVIQLGILLLIATPIARVALSLFAFAKQHDRTYVIITAIVLGILLWSLSGGGGM